MVHPFPNLLLAKDGGHRHTPADRDTCKALPRMQPGHITKKAMFKPSTPAPFRLVHCSTVRKYGLRTPASSLVLEWCIYDVMRHSGPMYSL
ncbi:hypothetical protein E2C01_081130 [Portunus trituberculatus]|uniref:Uncharacterized protein n=1 Tax=Portunus trituberculatus TaxID=210409 RepID=A0A5B7IXW3_PORTR|nr:hypothetical protein [Portunus trituberculatus]